MVRLAVTRFLLWLLRWLKPEKTPAPVLDVAEPPPMPAEPAVSPEWEKWTPEKAEKFRRAVLTTRRHAAARKRNKED